MKERIKSKSQVGLVPNGKRWLPELKGKLFQSIDAVPLGIFRFLFGLLLCLEFYVVSRETFPNDYIKPLFHFTYPLFDFLGLKPLPQAFLWWIFYVLRISAVGIMLGLLTRVSLVIFTAAFGYFFFMESAVYSNHYYLIFLLSFLLCLGHSGSTFSLDSLINKNARREQVQCWELFLLRFQICVVFFFGALAKMDADWLIKAAPLYLNLINHFSFLGHPMHEKWLAVALSWGGMLSDLALGILLLVNRWHKLTFIWLCLFNGINVLFFGLGIKTFPYLMISAYVLFLPTPLVREFVSRFLSRNSFPERGLT
jgi:vitamin K-dependent gamma-carboxylase